VILPTRAIADATGVPLGTADPAEDSRQDFRALVTVSRQHPTDFGERQVFVRIDDEPQVALRYGQAHTQEVGPGRHRLRANNTLFWKTIDFAVEPGEHIEFIVINKGTPLTLGIAGLLGAAPLYLKIYRRSLQ
jgi:hypothetical protein